MKKLLIISVIAALLTGCGIIQDFKADDTSAANAQTTEAAGTTETGSAADQDDQRFHSMNKRPVSISPLS